MVRGGAGPRVVTQGPVHLPEQHVRKVGIERALVSELQSTAVQPLAEAVAVALLRESCHASPGTKWDH